MIQKPSRRLVSIIDPQTRKSSKIIAEGFVSGDPIWGNSVRYGGSLDEFLEIGLDDSHPIQPIPQLIMGYFDEDTQQNYYYILYDVSIKIDFFENRFDIPVDLHTITFLPKRVTTWNPNFLAYHTQQSVNKAIFKIAGLGYLQSLENSEEGNFDIQLSSGLNLQVNKDQITLTIPPEGKNKYQNVRIMEDEVHFVLIFLQLIYGITALNYPEQISFSGRYGDFMAYYSVNTTHLDAKLSPLHEPLRAFSPNILDFVYKFAYPKNRAARTEKMMQLNSTLNELCLARTQSHLDVFNAVSAIEGILPELRLFAEIEVRLAADMNVLPHTLDKRKMQYLIDLLRDRGYRNLPTETFMFVNDAYKLRNASAHGLYMRRLPEEEQNRKIAKDLLFILFIAILAETTIPRQEANAIGKKWLDASISS